MQQAGDCLSRNGNLCYHAMHISMTAGIEQEMT